MTTPSWSSLPTTERKSSPGLMVDRRLSRRACQRVPRRITNFGSGALVMELNPERDRAVLGRQRDVAGPDRCLFAAFPMVYAIFLSAFYLPITLMLFGLIFRGAARRSRDFRNSGRICIFGGQIFVQSRGGAWGRSRGVRIFASAHEVLGEKP